MGYSLLGRCCLPWHVCWGQRNIIHPVFAFRSCLAYQHLRSDRVQCLSSSTLHPKPDLEPFGNLRGPTCTSPYKSSWSYQTDRPTEAHRILGMSRGRPWNLDNLVPDKTFLGVCSCCYWWYLCPSSECDHRIMCSGFSDESRASVGGSPFMVQLRDAINPLIGAASQLARQFNV